jgi:hypothetical protein
MKGFKLSCYPEGLAEISPRLNPAWTVRDLRGKLSPHRDDIDAMRGWSNSRKELIDLCGILPRQYLSELSFEDIAKIYWPRIVQMQRSVHEMFEHRAEYDLVRKLRNSMWHWGRCSSSNGKEWNTMVRAYHGIRQFDFGLSGFTARLDYSTHYNPRGYAQCSRVFLDGVFGFLVYHGDEHVLTIGFSVVQDDRLLVTQIQLVKPKGNRFLYKLPLHYVDYVLARLALAFPHFEIFLVDGGSLGKDELAQYRTGLESSRSEFRKYRRNQLHGLSWQTQSIFHALRVYRELKKHAIACKEAIPRMKRNYGDLHVYKKVLDKPVERRGLLFHPVTPVLSSV